VRKAPVDHAAGTAGAPAGAGADAGKEACIDSGMACMGALCRLRDGPVPHRDRWTQARIAASKAIVPRAAKTIQDKAGSMGFSADSGPRSEIKPGSIQRIPKKAPVASAALNCQGKVIKSFARPWFLRRPIAVLCCRQEIMVAEQAGYVPGEAAPSLFLCGAHDRR